MTTGQEGDEFMAFFQVPVGISNHHVHLSESDVEVLFGTGHKLTNIKDLSQPGQFACEEMVTLVGPKGSISKVRILGPVRKASQVELANTDTFKLGVFPPLRDSGQHEGTPGIELVGPFGTLQLERGVMLAARHIHMTPQDAQKYQVKDGDHVRVAIAGPRGGIFDKVLIRVNPEYALDLHVDTDEANAFSLKNGQVLEVLSN